MSHQKQQKNEDVSSEGKPLSRRQQQVMEIVYSQAPVTARQVWEQIANQPSYASVRTTLRALVEAGHLNYVKKNKAFVYSPAVGAERAAESALGKLVNTFYNGSIANAVSGLLGLSSEKIKPEELEELSKLIEKAKNKT